MTERESGLRRTRARRSGSVSRRWARAGRLAGETGSGSCMARAVVWDNRDADDRPPHDTSASASVFRHCSVCARARSVARGLRAAAGCAYPATEKATILPTAARSAAARRSSTRTVAPLPTRFPARALDDRVLRLHALSRRVSDDARGARAGDASNSSDAAGGAAAARAARERGP